MAEKLNKLTKEQYDALEVKAKNGTITADELEQARIYCWEVVAASPIPYCPDCIRPMTYGHLHW